jgi:hypothetical protein
MNANLNADFKTIFELDLDPIKVKLMHKESGEGWSLEQANAMEFEYRRFLCLMKQFPHEQVAPLFDVDIFWHYHILDTMKYALDCEQIFGYFLHHFPYSGLRGEDDETVHKQIGVRMQELYEATFGEAYIRHDAIEAVSAWSQPATAMTAWSQPANAKTAWSQPANAKTAWSQPAIAKTAWSQPATAMTAWSQPAIAKTAWSQPATAISEQSQALANTNRLYARPMLSKAA